MSEVKPKNSSKASVFDRALFDLLRDLQEIKIKKDAKNTYHHNSYASLPNVLDQIMPKITEHKFMLKFTHTNDLEAGISIVNMKVVHIDSGEFEEVAFEVKDVSTNPQQVGSFQTYARRYLPTLYFNLNIEGDDDDGNKASQKPAQRPAPQQQNKPPKEPVTHGDPNLLRHKDLIIIGGKEYGFVSSTYKSGKRQGQAYRALVDRDNNWYYDYTDAYKELLGAWSGKAEGDVDPNDIPDDLNY